MTQFLILCRAHHYGQASDEMKRQHNITERRQEEIQNLAIAKTTKDAEIVDLVGQLEGHSMEVCRLREERMNLASQCKEESRQHEEVIV